MKRNAFFKSGLVVDVSGGKIKSNLFGITDIEKYSPGQIAQYVLGMLHPDISYQQELIEEFSEEAIEPLLLSGGVIPIESIQDFLHFRGFNSTTTASNPRRLSEALVPANNETIQCHD
ncbi:hypothetical protein [Pseudoalteromonas galatheae]|uniref:hypothetical protein n=1 Tax=Pseudoalteromonas galatheae TaxID=579562 RepID=UPI0030D0CBCB